MAAECNHNPLRPARKRRLRLFKESQEKATEEKPAAKATEEKPAAEATEEKPAAKAAEEVVPKDVKICFAYESLESGFWVASHQAINQSLAAKGVEVIEFNANGDANRQLEQVKDCIAQGVDGIILIPKDGETAVTIVGEANKAGVPIGVYNRPPANDSNPTLAVQANNEVIAEQAVSYLAEQAKKLGRKVTPLIMVGDLGDPNAVARLRGFYNVIEANPDLFNEPIEVPTDWDGDTALANLEAALQTNPDVDLIFTSSDFLYPIIRSVLEPLGKWKKVDEEGHLIIGGLDGDPGACQLMKDGYVQATGVQDLFYEADVLLEAILEAIAKGEGTPENWMDDPGFALTLDNFSEKEKSTWGCLLLEKQ